MGSGRLFILSAASGTGKTSLAHALIQRVPDLAFSVSHTTRPPRPGERHGVDYCFVSPDEFDAMKAAGEFLEHAEVFGNRYGTSRAMIERLQRAGKDVILDIDWQGARAVKRRMPDAVGIFLLPPSRAALEQRLTQRGQDRREIVARRMQAAVDEMRHYREFDWVIVNDDFEAALADLRAIVTGEGKVRPLTVDTTALFAE